MSFDINSLNGYNLFYITGLIGSGKSTIGKKLAKDFGFDFIEGDLVVKENVNHSLLVTAFKKWFGEEAYINGVFNRSYISGIIFKSDFDLYQFNTEMSEVFYDLMIDLDMVKRNCIIESASIMSSKYVNDLKYLFYVTADEDLLLNRISKRNPDLSIDDIKSRIEKQIETKVFLKIPILEYVNNFEYQNILGSNK